jgi:hypothetical protein
LSGKVASAFCETANNATAEATIKAATIITGK